jgi:hypothetical protein
MPALPAQTVFSQNAKQDSWLGRVGENLHQLFTPMPLRATSANGAPLHLVPSAGKNRRGPAQAYSALTHGIVLALLLWAATHTSEQTRHVPGHPPGKTPILPISPSALANLFGHPSLGSKGGSGDENPIPPTKGNLAPRSPIQLLAPHLSQNSSPALPVPATIPDMEAPPTFTAVTKLGLPWMPSQTDSAGPGKNHGIGSGPGHGMGDEDGNDEGRSNAMGPTRTCFRGRSARIVLIPLTPKKREKQKFKAP